SKLSGLNREFSTTKMGFTLTTGVAWVFGLVDMEKGRYMKTEEIKIEVDECNLSEAYRSLRALMTLILIWASGGLMLWHDRSAKFCCIGHTVGDGLKYITRG
ncbi:hypothetical protein C0993_004039, partial [Termitomyces sp. T159_Od127]